MKTKKNKVFTIIAITAILASVLSFGLGYLVRKDADGDIILLEKLVNSIPGYSDYTIKEQRDADGNIILVEDVPYYYYAEKVFWEGDKEGVEEFNEKCYVSKENEDYVIYDYKDGVAISSYDGEGGDVVIPETLDGKKVVKLGCYQNNYFDFDDENEVFASAAFCDSSNTIQIKSIHIPSGVKEIVCYTFSTNGDSLKITVDEDNPYYYSFNGMLFSKATKKLLCAPQVDYSLGNHAIIVSENGETHSPHGKW